MVLSPSLEAKPSPGFGLALAMAWPEDFESQSWAGTSLIVVKTILKTGGTKQKLSKSGNLDTEGNQGSKRH